MTNATQAHCEYASSKVEDEQAIAGSEFWYFHDSRSQNSKRVEFTYHLPLPIEYAFATVTEPGPHYGNAAFFVHSVQCRDLQARILFSIFDEEDWLERNDKNFWRDPLDYRILIHGKFK